MDSGYVEYTAGKVYLSEISGCLTDNSTDIRHDMEVEEDFFEHFSNTNRNMKTFEDLEKLVLVWSKAKGILDNSTALIQLGKTQEELDETREALENQEKGNSSYINSKGKVVNTEEEIKDGYGDQLVTLINGAQLSGLSLVDCLEQAYNVIAKRQGKLVDGLFVKNE